MRYFALFPGPFRKFSLPFHLRPYVFLQLRDSSLTPHNLQLFFSSACLSNVLPRSQPLFGNKKAPCHAIFYTPNRKFNTANRNFNTANRNFKVPLFCPHAHLASVFYTGAPKRKSPRIAQALIFRLAVIKLAFRKKNMGEISESAFRLSRPLAAYMPGLPARLRDRRLWRFSLAFCLFTL